MLVGGEVFDYPAQGRWMTSSPTNVTAWTLRGVEHATVRTYERDVSIFFDAKCMTVERTPSERMRRLATKTVVLHRDGTIFAIGWLDEGDLEQEWMIFAVEELAIPHTVLAQVEELQRSPPWDVSIAIIWANIPAMLRIYYRYLRAWLPTSITSRVDVSQTRADIALALGAPKTWDSADKCLQDVVGLTWKLSEFEVAKESFLSPCPITYGYRPYRSQKGCAYYGGVILGRTTAL